MSDSTTTQTIETIDDVMNATLTYGEAPDPVYTVRVGDLPFHNLLRLAAQGFGHKMGNEAAAKVSAARVKAIREAAERAFPGDSDEAKKLREEFLTVNRKNCPAELFSEEDETRVLREAQAAMFETIKSGKIGRGEASARPSPLAAQVRAIAKEELVAAGIVFGKKMEDPIANGPIDGTVFTGISLLSAYVAGHQDRLLAEVEKRKQAAKRMAERLAKQGPGLAALGLAPQAV